MESSSEKTATTARLACDTFTTLLTATNVSPFLIYRAIDYKQLRDTTPIVGVWDDHDYGVNDGDARYKNRVMQKQVFLDYMDEP